MLCDTILYFGFTLFCTFRDTLLETNDIISLIFFVDGYILQQECFELLLFNYLAALAVFFSTIF